MEPAFGAARSYGSASAAGYGMSVPASCRLLSALYVVCRTFGFRRTAPDRRDRKIPWCRGFGDLAAGRHRALLRCAMDVGAVSDVACCRMPRIACGGRNPNDPIYPLHAHLSFSGRSVCHPASDRHGGSCGGLLYCARYVVDCGGELRVGVGPLFRNDRVGAQPHPRIAAAAARSARV